MDFNLDTDLEVLYRPDMTLLIDASKLYFRVTKSSLVVVASLVGFSLYGFTDNIR